MSDQPLTLAHLAQFHREVIAPELRALAAGQERIHERLNEFAGHFDAIFGRFERLEDEYQAIKAGLGRLEQRLDRVEQRLARVEQRLDRVEQRLERVEQRLDQLEVAHRGLVASVHRLEERLSRVEKTIDELVADQTRDTLRSEVADLRNRLDALHAAVQAIEKRLDSAS